MGSPQVPGEFGRYWLLSSLGEGGTAEVFLAEMTGPGGFAKRVALKLMHSHLLRGEPESVKSLFSEARLGGYLSHPNIVSTLDFGEHDGRFFIAMEYVDGPTLHQVLRACGHLRRPVPAPMALEILHHLLRALDSAHRATDHDGAPLRVVHRDLKPSNVLFTQDGVVKLADFGIARAESNLVHTVSSGVIKGTLRFMSPEQAGGSLDLDGRSDLFSLCAVLYEMLTLRRLFSGQSMPQLLLAIQDSRHEDLERHIPDGELKAGIIALLRRGLAREREERFPTAAAMGEAVDALLSSLPRQRVGPWLESLPLKIDLLAVEEDVTDSSKGASEPEIASFWEDEPTESTDSRSATPTPGTGVYIPEHYKAGGAFALAQRPEAEAPRPPREDDSMMQWAPRPPGTPPPERKRRKPTPPEPPAAEAPPPDRPLFSPPSEGETPAWAREIDVVIPGITQVDKVRGVDAAAAAIAALEAAKTAPEQEEEGPPKEPGPLMVAMRSVPLPLWILTAMVVFIGGAYASLTFMGLGGGNIRESALASRSNHRPQIPGEDPDPAASPSPAASPGEAGAAHAGGDPASALTGSSAGPSASTGKSTHKRATKDDTPVPVGPAWLTVLSTDPVQVKVGGQRLGPSPVRNEELTSGRWVVVAEDPQGIKARAVVKAKKGGSYKCTVRINETMVDKKISCSAN